MEAVIYIICSLVAGSSFMILGAICGAAYVIESEKKFKRPLKIVEPEDGEGAA